MEYADPDLPYNALRAHYDNAVRAVHEQAEAIEKLNRQNARLKQLYESSLAIVRRYQSERESLLARVQGALLGVEQAEAQREDSIVDVLLNTTNEEVERLLWGQKENS